MQQQLMAAAGAAEPEVIQKGKSRMLKRAKQLLRRRSRAGEADGWAGEPGYRIPVHAHNIGFLAVDRIAEQCGVMVDANRHSGALTGMDKNRRKRRRPCWLNSETYMNLSGMSILELVRKYEVNPQQDLIVIYDELDLALGTIRVRARGSSARAQRNAVDY